MPDLPIIPLAVSPARNILAVETSTEYLSLALLLGGQCYATHTRAGQGHSGEVLPAIHRLLETQQTTLAECAVLAFGCGPGAFTGLRIAAGVIQGLAFALDKPVIPIVSLQALARQIGEALHGGTQSVPIGTTVLSLLDARMGEVYCAAYQLRQDGWWETLTEPALLKPADVLSHLQIALPQTVSFSAIGGNGLAAYPDLATSLAELGPCVLPEVVPMARDVAYLASLAFAQGLVVSAAEAQPLYIRNKVAQTVAERMAIASAPVLMSPTSQGA